MLITNLKTKDQSLIKRLSEAVNISVRMWMMTVMGALTSQLYIQFLHFSHPRPLSCIFKKCHMLVTNTNKPGNCAC